MFQISSDHTAIVLTGNEVECTIELYGNDMIIQNDEVDRIMMYLVSFMSNRREDNVLSLLEIANIQR